MGKRSSFASCPIQKRVAYLEMARILLAIMPATSTTINVGEVNLFFSGRLVGAERFERGAVGT
jgi:hypothetical protein